MYILQNRNRTPQTSTVKASKQVLLSSLFYRTNLFPLHRKDNPNQIRLRNHLKIFGNPNNTNFYEKTYLKYANRLSLIETTEVKQLPDSGINTPGASLDIENFLGTGKLWLTETTVEKW